MGKFELLMGLLLSKAQNASCDTLESLAMKLTLTHHPQIHDVSPMARTHKKKYQCYRELREVYLKKTLQFFSPCQSAKQTESV